VGTVVNILQVSKVSKTFGGVIAGAVTPATSGAGGTGGTGVGTSGNIGTSRTSGGTVALQATDLGVAENDFITILGPSGCGKSTLLRMVAGLDTPTTGSITLDGRAVTGPGADRGMVFQSYTLFPWLTVMQNVCFGLREKGLPLPEQQSIARAFLLKVGLKDFENHFPKQLSGGMQQRTALARALANNPRILLMDEPFGALDHQTRELMQELLQGIWEAERKTILFVTHDIDEAIFMGTRVVVMSARPGRIKCDLPVAIGHPRHYSVKTTPLFTQLKSQLTEEIRIEVQRAAGLG
jgi:NitT/TauT family transport system ATP-binding protein